MSYVGGRLTPREIQLSCSCPDWAGLCKHVAAVLYGIGARFDEQPELLFRLREVDEQELIVKAGGALRLGGQRPANSKILGGQDLADVFGLEMAPDTSSAASVADSDPKKRQAALRRKRART